jgi:hypothetical protein
MRYGTSTVMGESSSKHAEGPVAKAIEEQTAKLPSDTFLWIAGGAAAVSLMLQLSGKKQVGNFIGQWVPTILIAGLYNKIVKVHGHDKTGKGNQATSAVG